MAAVPKNITLAELRGLARTGDLTDQELRTYFALDKLHSEAFAPAVRVNYAHVDTGGKELSPERTAALYALATAKRQAAPVRRRMRVTTLVARPRVLAEGDSWFNLPDLFYPKDAIDVLRQTHDVVNVAIWSDTIQNMVKQKQYVQKLKAGTGFRHFLFSGGGNDVLGSIGEFVLPRRPGDTNSSPANAASYVKAEFTARVGKVIGLYRTMLKDVRKVSTATVYVHGYANAVPKKNGPYLGERLEALGFDPATVGPLCKSIVKHMVDEFNTKLEAFATSNAGVVYVDLRPHVGANDWHTDEIHPKASGATKIAAEFAARIAAVPVI